MSLTNTYQNKRHQPGVDEKKNKDTLKNKSIVNIS